MTGPMLTAAEVERLTALLAGRCCEHGMDPHGTYPGGYCGVGGCKCLLTPSTIHHLLTAKADQSESLPDPRRDDD